MAQLLTKRENVQRQPKSLIDTLSIADWDFFLYPYWLKKIALNPQFYDDAKTNHGHCRCCSRVTPEGKETMTQKPTIRTRRSNLQQQEHSKIIIIKRVDPEIWSIECTIDKLQLNLCRTKEIIAIDRGFYVDGKRSIKTLIVPKYYRQARDLMRWIPTARPVPEFVINESDLSSKVIEELEFRIDYPKILTDILKQAVGRIFENLDFDRYHQSIARNLKVRVEP